jgi:hypothetical protein
VSRAGGVADVSNEGVGRRRARRLESAAGGTVSPVAATTPMSGSPDPAPVELPKRPFVAPEGL